jgi:hypothetical protein
LSLELRSKNTFGLAQTLLGIPESRVKSKIEAHSHQRSSLMLRTWLASAEKRRVSCRAHLVLEQLETRLTPTSFTWVGPNGATSWETPANWSGGNGKTDYPGWNGTQATTNDNVTFDGTAKSFTCGMAMPHTIAALNITGWAGKLGLNASLTVANGGSMDSGEIINPGQNATLYFAYGTFTCSGGNINWDSNLKPQIGNVYIYSAAELDFKDKASPSRAIGDNITNKGTVLLRNTDDITLYNRPTIANDGTMLVEGDGGRLLIASGDPVVTIQNSGAIQVRVDPGNSYTIWDAINMKADASTLTVFSGQLIITGADPSAGYSLLEPTGTVAIGCARTLWPTLSPQNGLLQTGGVTKTIIATSGKTEIGVAYKDYVLNGGLIQVGDPAGPSTPTFLIDENLVFKSGTIKIAYDTDAKNSSMLQADGSTGITITQMATTLAVSFFGAGVKPNSFDCMTAPNGQIIASCAGNESLSWFAPLTLHE